jgi:hypothetical protein
VAFQLQLSNLTAFLEAMLCSNLEWQSPQVFVALLRKRAQFIASRVSSLQEGVRDATMHRLSGVINLKLLLLHNFSNSPFVVDFLG